MKLFYVRFRHTVDSENNNYNIVYLNVIAKNSSKVLEFVNKYISEEDTYKVGKIDYININEADDKIFIAE